MSIHRFKGEYRFLSSMHEGKPIKTDDGPAETVEHGYQASKFIRKEDRLYILAAEHGVRAKKRSEAIKEQGAPVREDWDEVKDEIMEKFQKAKFHPGSLLAKKLVDTYPETIIEGNSWGDTYWGVDLETGEGENRLGKLLMSIRQELIEERS